VYRGSQSSTLLEVQTEAVRELIGDPFGDEVGIDVATCSRIMDQAFFAASEELPLDIADTVLIWLSITEIHERRVMLKTVDELLEFALQYPKGQWIELGGPSFFWRKQGGRCWKTLPRIVTGGPVIGEAHGIP
jgi:hypothetical protein